jgi:glycine dehydrogenase subunit 1
MLKTIGVASIDELFRDVPGAARGAIFDLPPHAGEMEVERILTYLAARNVAAGNSPFFCGAGAYRHHVPASVDHLIQRSEFLTSYTPYQPEISQGTLQVLFEFQTQVALITGMEVANASMYDGSTGAAEAILMAVRITGRNAAVVARSVHPEYREVMQTYSQHQGLPITECGYLENGRVDMADLDKKITSDTACVLIQSPNFFGTIEDVAAIADLAHKKGALLVVSIAEALSLGVVKPPVEADIISMETQSFGVPLGFGGPYAGVLATKEKFVRQIPGRLVGETTDKEGRRGFVLTLSTREQHIRREKATSNICTNQALIATMVTIYMTVHGREGLKELAQQNLAKAAYAAGEFSKKGKLLFAGAPRFNEFVVQTKEDPHAVNNRLLEKKTIGGFSLARFYPELGNAAVWCCTELNSKEQIDTAVQAVGQ